MDTQFKYAAIVFVSGFVLMSVELIAARVVAPLLGSSIYSWTAIIGTVLFGVSLGNYFGGKFIDRSPKSEILSYLLLGAAISIALIPTLVEIVKPLVFLEVHLLLKISVIGALLFLTPSILLGTIFPSALKLYLNQLATTGESAGLLSGLGALGSIVGTFLTGFFLIGFVGSSFSFYALALLLVVSSWTFDKNVKTVAAALIIISMLIAAHGYALGHKNSLVFETESNYYMIRVVDGKYENVDARAMFLDLDSHSIEGKSGEKVGTYQEISPVFGAFTKNIQDVLVLGGGSYQIPKDMSRLYGANVTVAEIDPVVTDTAKKFFNAGTFPIRTVNTDGRLFLKTSTEKFDIIFSDAFNSFISMPWYMATKENFELSRRALKDNGIYALSIISSAEGQNNKLYQSVLKTFASVFTNYYVLYLGKNENSIQNIILVGKNSEEKIDVAKLQDSIAKLNIESGGKLNIKYTFRPEPGLYTIILKDDFAPVERLTTSLVNSYIKPYSVWAYSFLK